MKVTVLVNINQTEFSLSSLYLSVSPGLSFSVKGDCCIFHVLQFGVDGNNDTVCIRVVRNVVALLFPVFLSLYSLFFCIPRTLVKGIIVDNFIQIFLQLNFVCEQK